LYCKSEWVSAGGFWREVKNLAMEMGGWFDSNRQHLRGRMLAPLAPVDRVLENGRCPLVPGGTLRIGKRQQYWEQLSGKPTYQSLG
jgi:hypothetical protein